MTKTIFEEMGGTYTQVGDYLLPNLKLPEIEQLPCRYRPSGGGDVLSAGKADVRGRRCYGATQGRQPNVVGRQDE